MMRSSEIVLWYALIGVELFGAYVAANNGQTPLSFLLIAALGLTIVVAKGRVP